MRSWTLLVVGSLVLLVASVAGADDSSALEDPTGSAPVVRWDDFDDPEFDPTAMAGEQPVAMDRDGGALAWAPATAGQRADAIPLGQMLVSADGVEGRLHVVSPGETLWDISDAYLGTPWVWPSVWNDNSDIENPHLIQPGDRLWITSTEMRVISEQEADDMMQVSASLVASQVPEPPVSLEPISGETSISLASLELEELPVAVPLQAGGMPETGRVVPVSWRENLNFVSPRELQGASSIVESPSIRTWLAQSDPVFIGLGEGEVSVGEQFTVFRDVERVVDPETHEVVGYHVNVLGWLEVEEVEKEASLATVRLSISEIARGDRIMRRQPVSHNVAVKMAQEGLEARIIYMPTDRAMMGPTDYVYLNRGSIHGLEVGTELEIFEAGTQEPERVRNITVRVPDNVVANLVVITLQPETAVAYVTSGTRELEVGEVARGARHDRLAQAPSPAF
jgi:hypothetical protein